jgi:subtilisin family serine protease
VAKGVWLVAVRVMNCAGKGTTEQVVAGVDWVTANAVKPAVVNMSLGGDPDPVLDKAVSTSIASGLTFGIAAGNGDANQVPQDACGGSPARVPEAITVSATQWDGRRASFANYGTCVDLFAPGVNISSAWIRSDTDAWMTSGTSMATPHVVGAAALVLAAHPRWSPKQVRDFLVGTATCDVVVDPGTGSPNLLLFVTNPTVPDFSMWMSPASASVPAGRSVDTTVATYVTAAPTQPVLVGLVGLPPDTTVTGSAISIMAGGSLTLHFATSPTTPPGNYLMTIEGTGSTTIQRTEFTLTVVPPPSDGS